jgi:hypothetical protein
LFGSDLIPSKKQHFVHEWCTHPPRRIGFAGESPFFDLHDKIILLERLSEVNSLLRSASACFSCFSRLRSILAEEHPDFVKAAVALRDIGPCCVQCSSSILYSDTMRP